MGLTTTTGMIAPLPSTRRMDWPTPPAAASPVVSQPSTLPADTVSLLQRPAYPSNALLQQTPKPQVLAPPLATSQLTPFVPATASLGLAAPVQPLSVATPLASVGASQSVSEIHHVAHPQVNWQNHMRDMFKQNKAIIYAFSVRSFGARDKDGDGKISPEDRENGTWISLIPRLDELVNYGVNTIHLLPINPPGGGERRFGEAGSLYATGDYTKINPEFSDPTVPLSDIDQARLFINEAHKRGIHVIVDVPSCASYELAEKRPDLIDYDDKAQIPKDRPIAFADIKDHMKTPVNWVDIIMFKNNGPLLEYYDKFFDLMVNKVGVDGFRVDVARARPDWFWKPLIDKYRTVNPQLGFFGETYIQEDQSPMPPILPDRPYDLMRTGFDIVYGQDHIFYLWNAKEFWDWTLDARKRTLETAGPDHNFAGTYYTHDDPPLFSNGGVPQSMLAVGMMMTQPWTSPYIMDGLLTGDDNRYDIFNWVKPAIGEHPEIGDFCKAMSTLRKAYEPVFTQGTIHIPPVEGKKNAEAPNILTFARHWGDKTLLIVANKDVNARQQGTLKIPGLRADQPLSDLAPNLWPDSRLTVSEGKIQADLAPGSFQVFEIDTPNIAQDLPDPFANFQPTKTPEQLEKEQDDITPPPEAQESVARVLANTPAAPPWLSEVWVPVPTPLNAANAMQPFKRPAPAAAASLNREFQPPTSGPATLPKPKPQATPAPSLPVALTGSPLAFPADMPPSPFVMASSALPSPALAPAFGQRRPAQDSPFRLTAP
jgi:glycosidase